MSKVLDRWDRQNEERGNYSVFAGFEDAIRNNHLLRGVYDSMNIGEQSQLFGFIADLLREESENG